MKRNKRLFYEASLKLLAQIKNFQILLTSLCGLFLVISFFQILTISAYLSVIFGSYFAIKSAWQAIKSHQLDVNSLMVLAAFGAVLVGNPIDAAALLFLFSLSGTLESMAMAKTKSAIEKLIQLRPDTAILINKGKDEIVPTTSLKVGDFVRIPAYQQITADGFVTKGSGIVDESAMTGESIPKEKSKDDQVFAGTQNLDHMLEIQVTAQVNESILEKIVSLVQEAQTHKASGEKISNWFGKRYTFFVLICFLIAFVIRYNMTGDFNPALYYSLTLLVALSPCALVISVPASTLSAIANAARQGILVRGGKFIETAGHVDTLALDKTGTLTLGKLSVQEIYIKNLFSSMENQMISWHLGEHLTTEVKEILKFAAAAERDSTHPIATAIIRFAKEQSITYPAAEKHESHSGLGVISIVEEQCVKMGQMKFFNETSDVLPQEFYAQVEDMQFRGLTAILVHYNDNWAIIGISDKIREEAKDFVKDLKKLGIKKIAMLTGDNPQTSQAIAQFANIEEFHHSLMPQNKSDLIGKWIDENRVVMMVGDGINDAPSLAKASVGVAMGGLGSDIALNAADVVLVQDKIRKIIQLIKLGKKTNSIIMMNLVFASSVIVILTITSMFFHLPLPLAVLGHEGSTVLVILNGLRLLRHSNGNI